MNTVDGYLSFVRDHTGYFGAPDYAAITANAHAIMAQTPLADAGPADGGLPGVLPEGVWRAIRAEQLAIPQGHGLVQFAACGQPEGLPWATASWYGVCGRPSDGSVVVTHVDPGSSLGLVPGDRVIATNRWAGPDFLEQLAREPVCGSGSPSAAHREEWAAASLFGLVGPGDHLTVLGLDGGMREEPVGIRSNASTWCLDPLGGYSQVKALATLVEDGGVGIIRINTFGATTDHPFPTPFTNASYAQWVAQRIEQVGLEFDKVKNAPALVWDLRSNSGGSQEVAVAIVGGFATSSGVVMRCFQRFAETTPPQFENVPTWEFSVSPTPRLAYSGRVAVVFDGMTYSAADVFARAVHDFAPLARRVGRPTAGAFGYGGNAGTLITGAPGVLAAADQMQCQTPAGQPIEGQSTQPTLAVEYAPSALAAGHDNVLQAAIDAVK